MSSYSHITVAVTIYAHLHDR